MVPMEDQGVSKESKRLERSIRALFEAINNPMSPTTSAHSCKRLKMG